jgi:hypothetical protein
MTATLATALLLQLAAVALLRHRLGRTWLRRPVTLLVLASVVYDGVSPLLMTVPSVGKWDIYRQGIAPQYADEAVLVLAAGMLALTVAYLLTRPERSVPGMVPADIRAVTRALDWRLLAAACAPLAVITYAGRGYNDAAPSAGTATALSANLASAFFVTLVLLAALGFLLRYGTRWFLPVLAVQSASLAAAGERTPVIIDAIGLGLLLAFAGRRPSRRQVAVALGLTLAAVMAITGLRAGEGRGVFYRDSGLPERLSALGSGLTGMFSAPEPGTPGIISQAAVRLDGTDWTAGILQARHLGQPRMSAAGIPRSLLLAAPSAVWPSKLDHGGLDAYVAQIRYFGLQDVNFLAGFAGLYAGMLTVPWLIAFLALCGLLAGRGERWLLARFTPARLVLYAGAVTEALWYEQGLVFMLAAFRAAVVVAAAAWLAGKVLAARPRRAPAPGGSARSFPPHHGAG